MKIIIALVLILSAHPILALHTIVDITPNDFIESPTDGNSVVINETLFYIDKDYILWQSNGDALSTKKVIINGAEVKVAFSYNSIIKFANKLLFVNTTDNNTIWESDGINFQQLSDLTIKHGVFARLHLRNNKVYTEVEDNILVIDENSTSLVNIDNIEYINMSTLCVFDDNNFSFYGRKVDSENSFYNFNNGALEEISSDGIETLTLSYKLKHNDSCIYTSLSGDPKDGNHRGFLKYNEAGDIELISNTDENQNDLIWDEAFVFNDKLYFFQSSTANGNYLYELKENSTQPVSDVIDPCSTCYNPKIAFNSDYLFFDTNIFSNNISDTPNRFTFVYDKDFNLINNLAENEVSPQLASIDNQAVFLYKENINRIVITDLGLHKATLTMPFANMNSIIGDGDRVYLFGNNREKKYKSSIYKISNQLAISNQLDGLWTNSNYKNQGLSIHTGVRQNGSQYIFVSFYIYKDGLPFWVAGNIDYLNGQSDVTVDLFEYEGSSFVTTENGLDDLQLSFGNLTITPIECNQIEVGILINNEQPLTLLMNRLTNNAKDGMCVD